MANQLADISIREAIAVLVSLGIFLLIILRISVPDQVWSAWLVILTFFYTTKPVSNGTSVSSQSSSSTGTSVEVKP